MTTSHGRIRMEAMRERAAATPLELFFDLVFVFALTQVTAFMAHDLSWHGVLQGMLIFGLLWWSWACYSWLGNVVRADEGVVRFAMFAAMAVMYVLALSIPEAFDDMPGGLHGPTVIAVCYFLFRAIHLVLFLIISADDPGLRGQILRFAPSMLTATALLLVAANTDGATQTALWAAALAADYLGTYLGGYRGWRLRSPSHFAERHGLILIVALGESIVAIGVGIAQTAITWPIVLAAVLGLMLSVALWWAYFDVSSLMAERALAIAPEHERAHLARDAYSFLHLPLVASVVLMALGLEEVLSYVSDSEHHDLTDALSGLHLYPLVGGAVLYLLAHVGFKLRTTGHLSLARLVVAVALMVMFVVGEYLPALATLAVLVAVLIGLIVFETVVLAEARNRIRHEHRDGIE